MDFELDEELTAVRDLAARIFADRATTERVRTVEVSPSRTDEALWSELVRAGLLGVVLPEEFGGAGLGAGALCAVLEQQGQHVAPVPLWHAAVAAMAVAEHGTAEQRASLLPGVADGSVRIALALEEFGVAAPESPGCGATLSETDAWSLHGAKAVVPTPRGARHALVSATGPDGPGLFLVHAEEEGVCWEPAETTSHDLSGHLTLTGAPAQRVGGAPALRTVLDLASTALAALQLGVTRGALRHAADYLGGREQFGRPLATFQAVAHQLADCYIDIECLAVATWHAAWAVDTDAVPGDAPSVAKWWAADAGERVVHRVQHLHGGIGVDTDYPVHRFFLWGKQIAGTLGGSEASLERFALSG